MPYLRLISIECVRTEDVSADEVVIKVAGNKVWEQDMDNGDDSSLAVLGSYYFTSKVAVKLYDLDDGSWPDYHDHLGTKYAYKSYVGQQKRWHFTGDGSSYYITYRVNK